jgi:hypothetical protein
VQARLQAELNIAKAQETQLQQVAMMQQSMQYQSQLQDQQLQRKADDDWAANAKAGIVP